MKSSGQTWNLISSHGVVLSFIDHDPNATIREIARGVQLTERRVMELLLDLKKAGIVTITRNGRNNSYEIACAQDRLHPIFPITISTFLDLFKKESTNGA